MFENVVKITSMSDVGVGLVASTELDTSLIKPPVSQSHLGTTNLELRLARRPAFPARMFEGSGAGVGRVASDDSK